MSVKRETAPTTKKLYKGILFGTLRNRLANHYHCWTNQLNQQFTKVGRTTHAMREDFLPQLLAESTKQPGWCRFGGDFFSPLYYYIAQGAGKCLL